MRTTHDQTESSNPQPVKFVFDPDRHYVRSEQSHANWDYDNSSDLLDIIDPATGLPAYQVEGDGTDNVIRAVVKNRKFLLLSCSAAYIEAANRANSLTSQENASRVVQPEDSMQFESIKRLAHVPLSGVIGAPPATG